jgi:sigma-B regulation protein RsbU (phosphoserine phosphatase)
MLLWALLLDQTFTVKVVRSHLRWEVLHIAVAIVVLVAGWSAVALFCFRRKTRDLTLLYFGLFTVLYGSRLLALQGVFQALFEVSPRSWALANWIMTCTLNVPIGLFFYQVANNDFRKLFRWLIAAQAAFAAFGLFAPFAGVQMDKLHGVNNVLVLGTVGTFLLTLLVRSRALWGKSISGEIRVLLAGFFTWLLFVLHANLASLHILPGTDVEFLAFLFCVGCLGYVSAHRTFANEERLLAIGKELEIARQIQSSILPREVPRIAGIDIAARYVPMSAVAGDFYDFLAVDESHIGVLIADVTGHGVPAALIASMLKVAFVAQSPHADDPARVLTGLNRALCGKFDDHFVTAAYVFLDTGKSVMRYAGAGHPPLMLLSRSTRKSQQIEENGLMLGLFPEAAYSAAELPLRAGDRWLLYTDGILEASNAAREEFGKARLEQFLEKHPNLPADRFAGVFLDELSRWSGHSNGRRQEDDITLVVLDLQHPAGAE